MATKNGHTSKPAIEYKCTFIAKDHKKIDRILKLTKTHQIPVQDFMDRMMTWYLGSPNLKYEVNLMREARKERLIEEKEMKRLNK